MLDVTSSASLVIRELIAGSNSTGGAGLRIAPAEEPAGAFSLSVAPGTFVRVTTPLLTCCGLNALPSRINSASNFPGPQLRNTVLTVS